MSHIILITGFPGFLGTKLVESLIQREENCRIIALVQEKFMREANEAADRIRRGKAESVERIRLITGDITIPGLGLVSGDAEAALDATQCFHLAAVYDLQVKREMGMTINVGGTENVVNFLGKCRQLKRFFYVSTAYVSGTHQGVFREEDLDLGQSFKNYYEETKFLAEKLVRERMDEIPTTIFRPSIVTGDSESGGTAKFDGAYFAFSFMANVPKRTIMVRIGSGNTEVNIVPWNYVIPAITRLSSLEENAGVTYNLADPKPRTVKEILTEVDRLMNKNFINVRVPPWLAKAALYPKPVSRFFGMPFQSVDYFHYEVHFDTSNTERDLAGSDITCPDFLTYLPKLLEYWEEHRTDMPYKPMV